MKFEKPTIDSFCFVTDYVANGSFASLKQGVTYRNKPDYAILVRVTDFTKKWNGNYVWVDKNSYDFLNKSSLNEGDLIIANVGETGKCFIVPNLGQPMTLGPNSILVRPQPDICNTKYLYYYFSSETGQAEIEKISSATTQSKFNKTSFRKLLIPLPPLHIQEQIADTLDKADALRRKDQELLTKYDELAQAIFYDMFGDPVKNEKGYKITTVEDISLKVTDGEHSTPQRTETGIKLLSARNIKNGYLDFDAGLDYIPESEFIRISKRCNPELNDILISCSGTIGRISAVRTNEKFGLVRSVALVKYKQDLLKRDYLEYFMQTDYFQKAIWRNVNTSSQSNLFTGQLKKLPILLPPLKLQSDFEKILSKLFKSKEICKNEKLASSNLYQSLMDKYFS
jgi:type I restriction enzyme S subunit